MPRVYTVTFNAVAVTAAVDLFDIAPVAGKSVTLLGIDLGQTTDFGDAQAEQLGLTVIRGLATVGSGGTAGSNGSTVNPLVENDTAAGFTARTCDTTVAVVGAGTTETLLSTAWNVQAGGYIPFPEGMQPKCSSAKTRIVVRQTAPADSITLNGTLYVAESD